jgi:hypothetical protein
MDQPTARQPRVPRVIERWPLSALYYALLLYACYLIALWK